LGLRQFAHGENYAFVADVHAGTGYEFPDSISVLATERASEFSSHRALGADWQSHEEIMAATTTGRKALESRMN
jgi:hypothetical protein